MQGYRHRHLGPQVPLDRVGKGGTEDVPKPLETRGASGLGQQPGQVGIVTHGAHKTWDDGTEASPQAAHGGDQGGAESLSTSPVSGGASAVSSSNRRAAMTASAFVGQRR